jgi:PAS domain S-box-containing protein
MRTAGWTGPEATGRPASWVARYALALSSVIMALLATASLRHPEVRGPLFVPAILLSAWYGGIGPGLLAVGLSVVAIHFYLTPPWASPRIVSVDDALYLIVFLLSALVIAWLTARQRRTSQALLQAHDELSSIVGSLRATNEALQVEIVERQRAEAEVKEQASLLDLTHDAMFARDLNDVITYWNRGAAEQYGWGRTDAIGKVSHDLMRTVFPAPLAEIRAEVLRTGRWEGELVHTRRDGSPVVVASRWSLQRDDHGGPAGVLETNNDITERKRAVEALEQRERRFRALIEHSSDGVILVDRDGSITYASPSAERVLGYGAAELVGQNAFDLVGPRDRQLLMKQHADLVQQPGVVLAAETAVRRKDGEWRWIESTRTSMVDEPGVQAVVANFRDVTERKQAEYLTSQVFESSPDGVAIIGRDYRLQRVNPTYERRTGMPAAEIVGMHVADLVGRSFFEQTMKPQLDRCLAGEDVAYSAWFGNSEAGGLYLALTHSPLRPNSTHVDAVLMISRDLTEHVRASEALQQAQAELARVTRVTMLGEITASIAHEVNQPLAAVVMNGNACRRWLAADPPNLDEAREAAQRIVSDGERAGRVIARIRALVRRDRSQKTAVDINDVILESLAFTRGELERRRVSARRDLDADLPPILGDRVQLQQVLVNLVLNGIDAMTGIDETSRVLTIRSRRGDADGVAVEVTDCGTGIKLEQREKIFEAFFSTKPGGLGMGLSISRSIVEAHGGRISASANGGAGVTMRFTLPAYPGGG